MKFTVETGEDTGCYTTREQHASYVSETVEWNSCIEDPRINKKQ
jgi:hypothetical protein